MMEASVVAQDTGQTSPLAGALDPPSSVPSPSSLPPSSPLSSPPLPSSPPHPRPSRPKPPPPAVKPSQLPSRPPLPPLPPPLSPTLSSFPPPPTPPPLFSPSSPSPPSPPVLSPIDRLVGSASVWQPKGLSQDKATSIMERETAGAFLVQSTEDQGMMLSVRLPDGQGAPLVHNLVVKQHKTFLHLEGSSLVFNDIFKLVSFYCVSRDVLAVPLRLPRVISMAAKKEELEVISAMGADFWTSELNQQAENRDVVLDHSGQPSLYWYINPVAVEENTNKDLNPSPFSNLENITSQNINSSLHNGESPKKKPEVRGPSKNMPNQDMSQRYKRPPPRPPSLGSGSGSGLLFSSPLSANTSSSLTTAAERKEEGRAGGGGEREERKSVSTSPPPLRPPVPLQSRAAPPLPPAPLRRTSSRKSADREGGEATEREKGHNPAKKNEHEGGGERGEEKTGTNSSLIEQVAQQEDSCSSSQHREEEGVKKEDEEAREKEEAGEERQVKMDKGEEEKQKSSSDCQPLVKKPSRPVPPPRRRQPSQPNAPPFPNPSGGGSANQIAGMRMAPPSPARRPDVSLYSPQGGAVVGTDPDSCSTSSTEEEGESTQEQEQNHSRSADGRNPKAVVKRTPTTVMLDRARHRLSTVLTGLISHDRRLTQRIVELARDPLSYFGNLVKEHRAFTLETMSRHPSSTELLQEIRQMMTQLKSYLLQSTELQAMMEPQHQYTQDKLETIVEAALCKSVLKPLREPIYRSLEKIHNDSGSLQQLAQNQSVVLGSTTTALGVTTAVPEAPAMEKISSKLNNLHLEYSPQRKIELLLKTCKIIYDSMSVSSPGRAHGADDFLPVMMYVLARSNMAALQLDVEYMMELMDPSLTLGEGSYYLTTTYGALEHIKTFDQQRGATRQLSREVQDSIHRWERRRTLNRERMAQGSVQDFLTVCCPEMGSNPKTLGVLPTTTIQELVEQCAARFEQDSYTLSVYVNDVSRPLAPTELALSVKSSLSPGAYCFVYHPDNQSDFQPCNSHPGDQPPATPEGSSYHDDITAVDTKAAEEEEESLISL
ncbi:ras and Rab interactor 3 [Centroberyx gerrardi]|uniref:ras and Rab interactor 3 n=1 Tax=Centroberyx gerrardi TaxID=166262 RepID=UPI003AAC8605